MRPTAEQQDAIELFQSGMNLAIQAGSGTGKTSTLRMLGESTARRGQYLVFNKAMSVEAGRRFPQNVRTNTVHSLAFRAVGTRYAHRLEAPRMRSMDIARILRVDPIVVEYDGKRKVLQPSFLGSLVMRSLVNFCYSAENEPGPEFVPYVAGIDTVEADGRRSWHNNQIVRAHVAQAIQRAWTDLRDVDGKLSPWKHDVYLKIFQLSDPRLPVDFVLLDEAQDTNGVTLSLFEHQTHAQRILVGDDQQCQPPGTLVQVVVGKTMGRTVRSPRFDIQERPIEDIRAGDRVVTFDMSKSHLYRSGRSVQSVASRWYSGAMVVAKCGARASRYTLEHRCVVRLADAFVDKHVVYVMRKGDSYRVGRATGHYATQGNAFGPALRAQAERADALWVLGAYDTLREAAVAEAQAAWKFGVPSLTFVVGRTTAFGDEGLADFWLHMGDLSDRAAALLSAFGRDIRFPLWQGLRDGRCLTFRRCMTVQACNLMNGMRMLPAEHTHHKKQTKMWWEPITVHREHYDGPVVSFSVEEHETYIADGLVTHNSIYGWRGSNINALQNATVDAVTFLSKSFRFGQEIADVANVILDRLQADLRLTGSDVDSRVDYVERPDCILARTNAVAMRNVLRLLRDGRQVHLVGGGDELVRFARAVVELKETGSTFHPELACFTSYGELTDYVDQDPSGDELALLVKLVEEFSPEMIIDGLSRTSSEEMAEVVVSTAHRSKGREWSSVQLADDFPETNEPEELRLLYVACTRAKQVLDVQHCEPMRKLLGTVRAEPPPVVLLPS